MFIVEIHNEEIQHRVIQPKSGNPPFDLYEQQCWVQFEGQPYPQKATVRLENGEAYSLGRYKPAASSFYIDRFGNIGVNLRLNEKSRVDLSKTETKLTAAGG